VTAAREAGRRRHWRDLPGAALALLPILLVGSVLALALAGLVAADAAGHGLHVLGRAARRPFGPPAGTTADADVDAPSPPASA
jgi:hypothetical protein